MSTPDAWMSTFMFGAGPTRATREVILDYDKAEKPWQPLLRFRVAELPIGVAVKSVRVQRIAGHSGRAEDVGCKLEGETEATIRLRQLSAPQNSVVEFYLSSEVIGAISRQPVSSPEEAPEIHLELEHWTDENRTYPSVITIGLVPRLRKLSGLSLSLDREADEAVTLKLPVQAIAADGHTTLCTLLAGFKADEVQLLKGRLSSSDVTVEVEAPDEEMCRLIGGCLRLLSLRGDPGLAQAAIEVAGSAGREWTFPVQDLLDVADMRRRLSLDNAGIDKSLVHILSAPALAAAKGRMLVPLRIKRTLDLLDEEQAEIVQEASEQRALTLELAWDHNPSISLEIPEAAWDARLFEPGGARERRPVAIPVIVDRNAPLADDWQVRLRLRLVAGRRPIALELTATGLDETPTVLAVELVPNASGAPASEDVHLPIKHIIEHLRTNEHLPGLRVKVEIRRQDDPTALEQLSIDILSERPRENSVLCFDWGTSTIAAGFADVGEDSAVCRLPLGEAYRTASGRRGRSKTASGAEGDDAYLIPSLVGLAPVLNFRARSRPFTFNDLRAQGGSDAAIRRRLVWLGRHYDISLPPDLDAVRRSDDPALSLVVRNLKLLLAERQPEIVLDRAVPSLSATESRHRVSVEQLVLDCLDELRGFYIIESIRVLATSRDPDLKNSDLAKRISTAISRGGMRLVLTYPCGLSSRLLERYRGVGRLMLERLDRGLFQPLLEARTSTAVTAPRAALDDGVVLVPESIAAAYAMLRRAMHDRDAVIRRDEPLRVIAFDIGAGTYDVSAIDVIWRRGGRSQVEIDSWSIPLHYGVRVGGYDLDKGLTRLVHAILLELLPAGRRRDGVEYRHHILRDDEGAPAQTDGDRQARPRDSAERDRARARREFEVALEQAKRALSSELFAATEAGGDYDWTDQVMRIKLGAGGAGGWPVALAAERRESTIAELGSGRIKLVCRRERTETTGRARPADASRAQPDRGELAVWLELENIFDRRHLDDFPEVREALAEVVRLGDLICRDLPAGAFEWLERASRRPGGTPVPPRTAIAVTGRAALWPPIFRGFVEQSRGAGRSLLGSPRRSARPLPPRDMKEIVLRGAYSLAQSRDLLNVPVPSAPLAIRFVHFDRQPNPRDPGRFEFLDDLLPDGKKGRLTAIDRASLIQICRVVPGIKTIAAAGNAAAIQLWHDLLPGAINPQWLGRNHRERPSELEIEVVRGMRDDIQVVELAAHGRRRYEIAEDGSTFMAPPPQTR